MTYLGATLRADGDIKAELNKKLGLAWMDFCALEKLWNHSSVSIPRKCQFFQSIITSRLLYGLSSTWLNVASRRRLNGFQARCLRRVLRIKPSFVSRVSNQVVLEKAAQTTYESQLLRQQLILFGKVARGGADDSLRSMVFRPGSLLPAADAFVRNVGRPRSEWVKMLLPKADVLAGSRRALENLVNDELCWKAAVGIYVASLK